MEEDRTRSADLTPSETITHYVTLLTGQWHIIDKIRCLTHLYLVSSSISQWIECIIQGAQLKPIIQLQNSFLRYNATFYEQIFIFHNDMTHLLDHQTYWQAGLLVSPDLY